MSINVTVTGNPVSIKRGKLITTDLNHANKEFQNRRRMRLEQVREQSKDIAESVRNKVRKEKSKQLSSFEKKSSAKLEEIKARKLLELQNQYQECLQDIGLAHSQAKIDEEEELQQLEEQEQLMKERARERGLIAKEKQQIIANEKNLKHAIPVQTKKMAREMENARSAMISNSRRKQKPRRSLNVSSDSDICEIVDILDDTGISDTQSRRSPKKKSRRHSNSSSPKRDYVSDSGRSGTQDKGRQLKFNQENYEARKRSLSPRGSPNRSPRRSTENPTIQRSFEAPMDTRISDRIKSRQISQPIPPSKIIHTEEIIIEDITEEGIHKHTTKSQSVQNDHTSRTNTGTLSTINSGMQGQARSCSCSHHVCNSDQANRDHITCQAAPPTCDVAVQKCNSDLPTKPTVSIRSTCCPTNEKKEYRKVYQYDHNNRFASNYIIDNMNVQRIPEESIEICADDRSEAVFPEERTFQREKVAEKRFKQALGKEKIQKDYKDLMKKLPVLQKQDRMATLDPDRDKFHMSEKRLDERERMRQQKLESAFEKLVPKTITIPAKNHREQRPSAAMKPDESLFINDSSNSTTDLKTLLEKLKSQKEILQKEHLPENSNLNKIISDMEASEKSKYNLSPKKKAFKAKDKSSLQRSSSSSLSSPRRKKAKNRRDVLILQNMSTQTSPKIIKCMESTTSCGIVEETPTVTSNNVVNSCECKDTDHLCEILIKIQENTKPEIFVSSPRKNKDVVDAKKPKLIPSNSQGVKLKLSPDNKRKKGKKKEININLKNIPAKPSINISNSWRDQFSKNDLTTSSTSYYSPPDYSTTVDSITLSHLLHKPQQQCNVNYSQPRPDKTIDPRLMTYIKKLLSMSKCSVDELGVSTVSEISTPSSSIINMNTNRPENKLINVLKFFNLNFDDVMRNLNQSQDSSKTRSRVQQTNTSTLHSSGYNASQSHTMTTTCNGSTINKSKDARQLSLKEYTQNNYPDIANKYSQLADVCQKRINTLSAMINQVRSEKHQILSPTNSDKENLTSYLNLPSHLGDTTNLSPSPEQIELNKKLLEIDKSIQSDDVLKSIIENQERNYDVDSDILDRYMKLLTSESVSPKNNQSPKKTAQFVPVLLDIPKLPKLAVQTNELHSKRPPPSKALNVARKFIADINVYPHELSTIPEGDSMRRSKSPEIQSQRCSPKKDNQVDGLIRIDNEQRPGIIELIENIRLSLPQPDSSGSSKSKSSSNKNSPRLKSATQSPHTYNINSSPKTFSISPKSPTKMNIPINQISVPSTSKNYQREIIISPRKKSPQQNCSPEDCVGQCLTKTPKQTDAAKITRIIKKLQEVSTDTSTEKSELDIENMLKNMGMGWAVSTIRKTQQALAKQSSSTSSFDVSSKHSESSDISLKDFLTKELIKSSSTAKSDASISPYFKELQDLSEIQGGDGSIEKQHRTSTPVHTTRSSDKSKNDSKAEKIFTAESDLSSVQGAGNGNAVHIGFVSLHDFTENSNNAE